MANARPPTESSWNSAGLGTNNGLGEIGRVQDDVGDPWIRVDVDPQFTDSSDGEDGNCMVMVSRGMARLAATAWPWALMDVTGRYPSRYSRLHFADKHLDYSFEPHANSFPGCVPLSSYSDADILAFNSSLALIPRRLS